MLPQLKHRRKLRELIVGNTRYHKCEPSIRLCVSMSDIAIFRQLTPMKWPGDSWEATLVSKLCHPQPLAQVLT